LKIKRLSFDFDISNFERVPMQTQVV